MEDHVKRELGCEEGEEPLRGVHMSLQTHIQEMVVQIRYIFLYIRKQIRKTRLKRERQVGLVSKYTQLYSSSEDDHCYDVH